MYIAEYALGTSSNHIAVHDRKLLLGRRELKKLEGKLKDKGYTIVPLRVFFNDRNLVKVEIGLGRGKKLHDKRETMKERDTEREIKRYLK
jgi:SsrA-binding protein